jgi:hypothetical protein
MAANSEIILSNNTHPGNSDITTVTGSIFKGDGYYGRSDGFHTVQYTYSGLIGTIAIQATLATEPLEDDWFDVHTYTAISPETASKITNFTGNYVWIRAQVVYTAGSINSITLNH